MASTYSFPEFFLYRPPLDGKRPSSPRRYGNWHIKFQAYIMRVGCSYEAGDGTISISHPSLPRHQTSSHLILDPCHMAISSIPHLATKIDGQFIIRSYQATFSLLHSPTGYGNRHCEFPASIMRVGCSYEAGDGTNQYPTLRFL